MQQTSLPLIDRLLRRFAQHYIVLMMIATRLSGSVGGVLVVYYVNLTLTLPPVIRRHFQLSAIAVVAVAVTMTIFVACWETRALRRVLRMLAGGQRPDRELALAAGREAVLFPVRHHRYEAWLVPTVTWLPVVLILRFVDQASADILTNVTLAVFMGIGLALMSTFFIIERCMQPVIRYLLDHGLPIDFDALPASRLRSRMNLCFGLVILITSLMIGTLARQRASDIIQKPENQDEAVANLRAHTTYITFAAVLTGLVFSTGISDSVASRVARLVQAMRRVETGSFSEKLHATGTDEIDHLTRQFNSMVMQLAANDHTIRDLNTNLERKVAQRTRQVSKSRRKLARSLRQLQEHDRVKTEFFSNVSHELRTPLTMILSPVGRVLEKHGQALPGEVVSLLDVVRVNGRRLLELINRLLEFSKLQAGGATLALSKVELNNMVQALVAAASPLAEQRRVQLRAACDPDVPPLGADAEKLETVITNLVSNALKFTPENGLVEVETRLLSAQVRLSVRDTGIGIHPNNHARIFERFVQIDGSSSREFPGTGLGLALAKELVELHGGDIHVESELGKGSHFIVHLPLTPPPAGDQLPAAAPLSRAIHSQFADLETCDVTQLMAANGDIGPPDAPRVLVVDDTPEVRALIANVLSDQYRVLLAQDGAEGLEVARGSSPDLIISDVMMPVMDGYEFCRRIKDDPATAHIPFVMLTAKADKAMKIEGLDSGADDYLVKPFDTDELRARARSLVKLRRLHRELDQRNNDLESAFNELRDTQTQLMDMAHRAGMTEIASGVLHNVGNVLNSVNISITMLGEMLKKSKLAGVARVASLLNEHAHEFQQSPHLDRRVKQVPEYLDTLSETLSGEQRQIGTELGALADKIQHIMNIIRAQQNYTRRLPFKEQVDLKLLIDDLLSMHAPSISQHRVAVNRDYQDLPAATIEKSKLLQVLDNLIKNAIESMADDEVPHRELTVRGTTRGGRATIVVSDTGRGIPREIVKSLFRFGFTTKRNGNGFGLHSSALAMSDMGGSIQVHSGGQAQGAAFTIEFPLAADPLADSQHDSDEPHNPAHDAVPI
ncbi:MAG: ATP-binding protein [Pirellulales bacterium]